MTQKELEVFKDKHKFQDDVWEQIILNDLERDVIDTPGLGTGTWNGTWDGVAHLKS